MIYEVTFKTVVNLSEGELEDALDDIGIPMIHYTIEELEDPS